MTIENSTLNTGKALPESNASYSGASGDGCPDVAALKRGYAELADQSAIYSPLPGFLSRPQGWER